MDIIEFLSQEYRFTLTGFQITLGIIVLSIISFAIITLIVNLVKRIKFAETPKYGFLGKPLYQATVLAVLALGGAAIFLANNPMVEPGSSYASEDIDYRLDYKIVKTENTRKYVDFEVVPILNDIEWSKDSDLKLNIFVSGTGSDMFTELMYDKSINNRARFTKILKPGKYQIKITINTSETSKSFIQDINL